MLLCRRLVPLGAHVWLGSSFACRCSRPSSIIFRRPAGARLVGCAAGVLSVGGSPALSWRSGTRRGPRAWPFRLSLTAALPPCAPAVRLDCRRVVSLPGAALPIVVCGRLAANRCRVGLLYSVESWWALLYSVRIVTSALRAGCSEASLRDLCSTSFRVSSSGVGGRYRSTANRVRGGGAGCVLGAVRRRFGVVRHRV